MKFEYSMIYHEASQPPTPDWNQAFQRHYSYEIPMAFLCWEWSCTFGRWGALVLWYDGTKSFTYPEPQYTQHQADAWDAAQPMPDHPEHNTKYFAKDCSGWALQFTGSGRSVQCTTAEADTFNTMAEAELALNAAGECGGTIEPITFGPREYPDATDADGVIAMKDMA